MKRSGLKCNRDTIIGAGQQVWQPSVAAVCVCLCACDKGEPEHDTHQKPSWDLGLRNSSSSLCMVNYSTRLEWTASLGRCDFRWQVSISLAPFLLLCFVVDIKRIMQVARCLVNAAYIVEGWHFFSHAPQVHLLARPRCDLSPMTSAAPPPNTTQHWVFVRVILAISSASSLWSLFNGFRLHPIPTLSLTVSNANLCGVGVCVCVGGLCMGSHVYVLWSLIFNSWTWTGLQPVWFIGNAIDRFPYLRLVRKKLQNVC